MGLMTAMVATMIVGTALKTVGDIKSGNAMKRAGEKQQEAAESQAELGDYNANVAELQAEDAILRGELDEQRFRSLVRGAVGSQRAGMAAQGVDVNHGSAVDVQADAATLGELDALTIKTNARREAWGYEVQGENFKRGAEVTRKGGEYAAEAGRSAQTASRFNAAGTIVGGANSLLAMRYGLGGKK
jgi:hypothetical protein